MENVFDKTVELKIYPSIGNAYTVIVELTDCFTGEILRAKAEEFIEDNLNNKVIESWEVVRVFD